MGVRRFAQRRWMGLASSQQSAFDQATVFLSLCKGQGTFTCPDKRASQGPTQTNDNVIPFIVRKAPQPNAVVDKEALHSVDGASSCLHALRTA